MQNWSKGLFVAMYAFQYIYCSIISFLLFPQMSFHEQEQQSATDFTKSVQQEERMFQVGEELEYSVHYSIFQYWNDSFQGNG